MSLKTPLDTGLHVQLLLLTLSLFIVLSCEHNFLLDPLQILFYL